MTKAQSIQLKSGKFIPVWTLEIQTPIEDVDKILEDILRVHPLSYGRYQRNASISAQGFETSQPKEVQRLPFIRMIIKWESAKLIRWSN